MNSKTNRQDIRGALGPYAVYLVFSVLTGVIIYFSLMANSLVNNLDGIWHPSNFIAGDWEISLGRGLQRYADRARFGLVSNPWNSLIFFVLFGISDCLIIKKFKLERTFFSYLFIFISLANPIVCESLTYSYMSVNFALAFFFAVLSFYFVPTITDKKITRRIIVRILVPALSFGVSMAFYQAYICVFAVLSVFSLLAMIKAGAEIRRTVTKLALFFAVFTIGGLIYFVITKLLLLRAGVEMASYKGADNIGLVRILKRFPESVVLSYQETFGFLVKGKLSADLEFASVMIWVICAVLIFVSIMAFIRIIKEEKKHAILFAMLMIIVPAAASCICIIAVGNGISRLMAMGILIGILLFYTISGEKKYMSWVMNITYILMAWYLVSAVENDQIALKEGITATRNMTENAITEMYTEGLLSKAECIAFVGRTAENPLFYKSTAYEMANGYAQFGRWSTEARNNMVTWIGITETMCGVSLPFCGVETYSKIVQSDEVRQMPIYPLSGYMKIIDGVLVIKMSDLY